MAKSDLLRSHDELRAALVIAGKEIRKLNFGRSDTPVLKLLRRVLREARIAKADAIAGKGEWRGDSWAVGEKLNQ
jgi:hypothetical protein